MELILFFSVIVIAGVIIIYNLLVRDKNRVQTAWSDIDVQLKRRHDLIPKLVDAVKQYAAYETATLTAITELRTRTETASVTDRASLEQQLGQGLHSLFVLAEDYPELQANESFLDLQRNLTAVEKDIQHARRYYNGCVRNLNIRIESFPDMLIANLFRFRKAEFFEMEE